MKRILLGTSIFVILIGFFGMNNNLEIAMNVTGIVGIAGILLGGFLKTGFISSSAPVLGNLAVIKLDNTINLSNTILLLAMPNFIGAAVLYFMI